MNPIGSCRSTLVVLAACLVLQLAYAVPTQNDGYREFHGPDGEDENVAHRLDSIGGAHLIRELERQGHLPRQTRGGLDSLSGITFGGNKRLDSLSGITFGNQKRNFDEIDRAGFNSFVKKNFDEIDRAGFDSFVKRNFDEIDRVGFGSFVKRNSPLLLARLYDKQNN